MKQRILVLLLIVSMLMFSACTGTTGSITAENSEPEATEVEQNLTTAAQQISTTRESASADTDGIRQVGDRYGMNIETISPSGLYQIQQIFTGGSSIIFTDYATNTQRFLCNNPDCTHDSTACQSYFDTTADSVPQFIYVNDKLLLFTNSSNDKDFKPKLELMDADGSNRRIIAEFETTPYMIIDGQICADATSVYFMIGYYDDNSDTVSSKSLCSLNLQTRELKKIMDCSVDEFLLDGIGNHLYMKRLVWPQLDDPNPENYETDHEYMQALEDQTLESYASLVHQIYEINLDQLDQQNIVLEWTGEHYEGDMIDGTFYYYDTTNDTFNSYNCAASMRKSLKNTTGYSMEGFSIDSIIDGKLVCNAITGHTFEDDFESLIVNSFAIDFTKGEITEIGLLNNWDRPIYLCGEYEDKIFVEYNIETVTRQEEVYGIMSDVNYCHIKMGYLTLDDFFNGNGNYVPTDMAY